MPGSRARGLVLGVACAAFGASGGAAQRRPDALPAPVVVTAMDAVRADGAHAAPGALRSRRPWTLPLMSLVVPGSGQLVERQDRGLIYLVAEVGLAARAASLTRAGRRERQAFHDLAFRVARAPFTAVRREGSFEYYERMTHYVESGVFDRDPGPTLAPETDTLTFNGATWLLARRTFFLHPDSTPSPAQLQAALAFYQARAVGPAFRWSWRDARLEQDVFRARIRSSDEAFRAATNYFGALLLNHLGSAVDALITIRTGGTRVSPAPRVESDREPGRLRLVWGASF